MNGSAEKRGVEEWIYGASSMRQEKSKLEPFMLSFAVCLFFAAFWVMTCIPLVSSEVSFEKTESNHSSNNDIVGWERGVSRDPKRFLDSFKDIISGQKICKNINTKLIIIVMTHPSNFLNRSLIRDTWASLKVHHVKVGFLVGLTPDEKIQNSLEEESALFKDIIQVNLIDTYRNLTLKSISLLQWYIKRCPVPSILLKADHDTFIDVRMLVRQLKGYRLQHEILMGCLYTHAPVIRDVNDDKFYVPKYMFEGNVYPEYISGSAYIMSWDVARRLYAAALETPIFHLEDVYITGICARKAGVMPRYLKSFTVYLRFPQINCRPRHAACHPVSPEFMRTIWKERVSQRTENNVAVLSEYNIH